MREFKATPPDAIENFTEDVCCVHSVRPPSVTTSRGESRFRRLGTLKVVTCLLLASLASVSGGDQPKVLSLEQALKRLPPDFHIYTGNRLAFYQNKLYAGSGSGLLEITNGSISKVYKWNRSSPSVDDVCHDIANGLLWARPYAAKLAYYDGRTWRATKYPKPKHGYVSRMDALLGYWFVSNDQTFWMQGAGRAWAWQKSGAEHWVEERLPLIFGPEQIPGPLLKRMIATDVGVFFIKRGAHDYFWRKNSFDGDSIWSLTKGKWSAVTNTTGVFFTQEAAGTNRKGYIQTQAGDLLEVTEAGLSKLKTPGKCEAIVRSGTGSLLASFRDLGVFELKGEWYQLLQAPYPEDAGEYEIGLAEHDGQIALVFCPKPEPGMLGSVTLTYKLPHGLWISHGREWKQVPTYLNNSNK